MRVIAGKYKGRNLKAPAGRNTRPTTDRIKESLFSSILSYYGDLDGCVVLDAFAGSGALGIECMSRGAKSVQFFERDREALKALNANVELLGLADATRVRNADVFANPPVYGVAFNIVLLDPPYAYDAADVFDFLAKLNSKGMLAQDALITYEHACEARIEDALCASSCGLRVVSEKTYGKTTAICFLGLE